LACFAPLRLTQDRLCARHLHSWIGAPPPLSDSGALLFCKVLVTARRREVGARKIRCQRGGGKEGSISMGVETAPVAMTRLRRGFARVCSRCVRRRLDRKGGLRRYIGRSTRRGVSAVLLEKRHRPKSIVRRHPPRSPRLHDEQDRQPVSKFEQPGRASSIE